jgi:hypothetical protein
MWHQCLLLHRVHEQRCLHLDWQIEAFVSHEYNHPPALRLVDSHQLWAPYHQEQAMHYQLKTDYVHMVVEDRA